MKYRILHKEKVCLWNECESNLVYGLFAIHYHNWHLSSIESEDPIGWRYDDLEELKRNSNVEIEDVPSINYSVVLNTIHFNFLELLQWN